MVNLFWERFYNLCIEKGTKPNPVAKSLNISSGIVSKWKNTDTLPNGDNLAKIADCLGCSVDYLLGRADAPLSTYGDGFTPHDKALVEAYKKQPAVQQAVDKLLNLDTLSFSLYSASAHIPEEIAAYGGSQTRGEQPPVNPQITPPQKKRG